MRAIAFGIVLAAHVINQAIRGRELADMTHAHLTWGVLLQIAFLICVIGGW